MNDHTTVTGRPRVAVQPERPPSRAGHARWALLAIVLVAIGGATGYWYLTKDQVTTDDAFTDGHAVTVAPQVSGAVLALKVRDNQRVKAGDVLIEIDPRAYSAARDQAQGSLRVAEAQLAHARITLEWARIEYPARLAT